ncbi:MAG: formate C-acetyltransferase [Lentimonas sp.]|jgi:formate C-acetyltransferase
MLADYFDPSIKAKICLTLVTEPPIATKVIQRTAAPTLKNTWRTFDNGGWQDSIDVRDFIQKNYTPYTGDYAFLKGPTAKTNLLWDELKVLLAQELEAGGVLDADTKVVGTVASHSAGYINKDLETNVGAQTDEPLKRAMLP